MSSQCSEHGLVNTNCRFFTIDFFNNDAPIYIILQSLLSINEGIIIRPFSLYIERMMMNGKKTPMAAELDSDSNFISPITFIILINNFLVNCCQTIDLTTFSK